MHGDYQNCQSAPQRPPKNTPTTANKRNDDGITQLVPQEQRTWNNEDPPKYHVPYPELTILHYTTKNGPHLYRQSVPHQDIIHTRKLYYQLPDTTNRHGTDGQKQAHKGGIRLPMPKGLP